MTGALAIEAGPARAEIAPDAGAALASLVVDGRPALCPKAGRPEGSPFALAMNLLLPFSNRVSGPFRFEGRVIQLPANLEGEPFPIHGDAFQRPWAVADQEADAARLRLAEGGMGPFRYEAEVLYRLTPSSLRAELRLTSRAEAALPWGLGFHPWFPRDAQTRIRFRAGGHWPQDPRHLPATPAPVALPPGLDFSALASPPRDWINAAFSGWNGEAEVAQGETAVSLRLSAGGLGTLILYSPSAQAPFLCLEPVSHPVDAHNLPGQPGLVRLAPGESLSAFLVLSWDVPTRGEPARDKAPRP